MSGIIGHRGLILAGAGDADPYWSNVVALLHFDGTHAGTTMLDETGRTWNTVGAAEIDTVQSKFGGSSLLVSGGYIQTANSPDFHLESGDFTLEIWHRPSVFDSRKFLCGKGDVGAENVRCFMEITAARTFRFATGSAGNFLSVTGATVLSLGQWVHLAVTKQGTTWRTFVNGIKEGEVVSAATFSDWNSPFFLGRCGYYAGLYAKGHFDEFRVTKGLARYINNFIPPAAAFPNHG